MITSLRAFGGLGGPISRDLVVLETLGIDGSIDVWVNNAGTSSPTGAVIDVPLHMGELVISTNVLGVS